MLVRLSPDSARTKNPSAKMAVTQKINRAALGIFILLVLFYAPALGISLCRNAADALRFSSRNLAQAPVKKASKIFKRQRQNLSTVAIKR
jgi:hypothetical protein